MARKGSRKVRTGCLTCKARKVKCDEGKPHCNRCTSTGRKCDGYAASNIISNDDDNKSSGRSLSSSSSSTNSNSNNNTGDDSKDNVKGGGGGAGRPDAPLVLFRRPRQLFHGINSVAEGRALQYFCEIAAPYMPYLPGVTDPYFWSQLVMQFSSFEPAVRHSIVAISSLYEQARTESRTGIKLRENRLALRHYNAAIAELKTMQNPSVVLLVCILFICIEFLQANREAAIRHCSHGMMIMSHNSSGPAWVKQHLLPMFRRLSLFPLFFGTGSDKFPSLSALADPIPTSFSSLSEARAVMDDIFGRTFRLVRVGDPYRFGSQRYGKVPPHLLVEQEQISELLDQWHVAFRDLETRFGPLVIDHQAEDYMNSLVRVYLSICYENCRIYSSTAFAPRETAFDAQVHHFRRMLDLIELLDVSLPEESLQHGHSAKYLFEMGFVPMTFLLATKCRVLPMRLAALRLMKLFCVSHETGDNLWEVENAHDVARYVIGVEHGVVVDKKGRLLGNPTYPGFPPDEVRIRETRTEYKSAVRFDAKSGREDHLRVVHFFMRTPDDSAITIHTECFPMDFDAITQAQNQSPSPPSQSSSSPEIEHVHSQLVCGL